MLAEKRRSVQAPALRWYRAILTSILRKFSDSMIDTARSDVVI